MGRKRKFGLIVLILVMFLPVMATAQGAVDFSHARIQATGTIVLSINWTADGAGEATANFSEEQGLVEWDRGLLIGTSCYYVVTSPGLTPPAADYDVLIADGDALDIFGGQLGDRSAIIAENAAPLIGIVPLYGPITCVGDWSVTITGAGAGGQGKITVLFR